MPKSILDPTFRYTSSANTNLRKTFAKIRRRNEDARRRELERIVEDMANPPINLAEKRNAKTG